MDFLEVADQIKKAFYEGYNSQVQPHHQDEFDDDYAWDRSASKILYDRLVDMYGTK